MGLLSEKSTENIRLKYLCNSCGREFFLWDFRESCKEGFEEIGRVSCPFCNQFDAHSKDQIFDDVKTFPQVKPTVGEFIALTWDKIKYLEVLQRQAIREYKLDPQGAADYASAICAEEWEKPGKPFRIVSTAEYVWIKQP